MIRLLYSSTSTLDAGSPFFARQIGAILGIARARNAVAGVTGVLAFTGGRFAQVLEGPDAAVEAVFARIAGDPRHCGVETVARAACTTRLFGDWSMAYVGDDPRLRAAFDALARAADDRSPANAEAIVDLLAELVAA